ncbi:MAG: DUF1801 domain-containing protein [Pseudomonadota bacterium]
MARPAVADAYFEKQPEEMARIARALADRIEAVGPGLACKLAWGFPCWSGNERIVSVTCQAAHCNLQLWSGARLTSLSDRIVGTGKALRHVKLRTLADVDSEIDVILNAAIALDATDPQKVR